jgi:hypothetical protein
VARVENADSRPTQLQGLIDTLVDFVEGNHEFPVNAVVWEHIRTLDALIGQRCIALGITIPTLEDVTNPAILRLGFTKILYRRLRSGHIGVFVSNNWLQAMRALRIAAIDDDARPTQIAKPANPTEALEIAKFCKDEADALRALSMHTNSDLKESCRTVLHQLRQRLRAARQPDLASKVDLQNLNPLSVIPLLSEIQRALEDFAERSVALTDEATSDTNAIEPAKIVIDPDASPEPDGPHPPNRLVFGGKEKTLQTLPWLLIQYMWERDFAPIDDVCQHLWHDPEKMIPDRALMSAQVKANKALKELGVGWLLSRKSGYMRKVEPPKGRQPKKKPRKGR